MVHHWRQCKYKNLMTALSSKGSSSFNLGTKMASYPFMLLQIGDLPLHLNTYWRQAHL